jgi:hypothetical protein
VLEQPGDVLDFRAAELGAVVLVAERQDDAGVAGERRVQQLIVLAHELDHRLLDEDDLAGIDERAGALVLVASAAGGITESLPSHRCRLRWQRRGEPDAVAEVGDREAAAEERRVARAARRRQREEWPTGFATIFVSFVSLMMWIFPGIRCPRLAPSTPDDDHSRAERDEGRQPDDWVHWVPPLG